MRRLHHAYYLTKEECRADDRCGPILRDLEENPNTADTLDLLEPPASLDPIIKFQTFTRGDCNLVDECRDAYYGHSHRPDIMPEVILGRPNTLKTTPELEAILKQSNTYEGDSYLGMIWHYQHENIITAALVILAIATVFFAFYYLYLKPKLKREKDREERESKLYGSAAWMLEKDAEKKGIWGKNAHGMLVGYHHGEKTKFHGPICYNGNAHLLTFAPTGSGKGVSSIIPNLLTYTGSIMCIDPKGENAAVTARRRRELGQKVVLLDPWELVADKTDSFNPIDWLDPESLDFDEDCMMIADTLVQDSGGIDSHWDKEAKSLITGLIMFIAIHEKPERKSLIRLYELLSQSQEKFTKMIGVMMNSDHPSVKLAGNRFDQKSDREAPAVISSAQAHLHFLASKRMQNVLSSTTFDPMQIKSEKMTVFLILPPDRLSTMSPWLRLIVSTTIASFSRDKTVPDESVLFLLDEFASLGELEKIKTAMGLMRGYGVKLWPILQDLSQLKGIYPQFWESFIANAGAIQVFGTNDGTTAHYFSEKTGVETTYDSRENAQGGRDYTKMSRHLLKSDEVMRMKKNEQLILLQNEAPMKTNKLNYLNDKMFRGEKGKKMFDHNPYYKE